MQRVVLLRSQALVSRHQVQSVGSRSFASKIQSSVADKSNSKNNRDFFSSFIPLSAGILGAWAAGTITLLDGKYNERPEQKYESPRPIPTPKEKPSDNEINIPPPRPDLPTFTIEEVSEHNDLDSMWFTFR